MSEPLGQSKRVSLGRRVTCDFLRLSMTVPTVSIQKVMDVSAVKAAREKLRVRPSWSSIFTKAYAKVAAARADLRRAFLTIPWERMFEYHRPVADIVIETQLDGEDVLVTVPLENPDACPLLDIDRRLAECKEKPIERVRVFRHALYLARFPAFLRHCAMKYVLNASGYLRSRYFGTFGVTSVGNWGVESVRPLSPWISLVHYGTIDSHGNVTVRLTYDHRVLDGSGPSRALVEMEQFLQTDLLAELQAMQLTQVHEESERADQTELSHTPGHLSDINGV